MIHVDLLLKNANILTVDGNDSTAQALAVQAGRFLAVGSNQDLEGLAGTGTRLIDARGRTVLPGFIDAHCHLLSLTAKTLLQVDCSAATVKSIEDIVNSLRKQAARTPKGRWIQGARYDDTKLEERRHPTRWDLDRASTEHPIHLRHVSGHLGVVNSLGFAAGRITRDS